MLPTEQIGPAFVFGLIVMMFQDWLKRFSWYSTLVMKFPAADKYVHKGIAGIFSLVAAVGVTMTFAGDLNSGGWIKIVYPDYHAMLAGGWNFITTYVVQSYAYKSTRQSAEIKQADALAPPKQPQPVAVQPTGNG